MKAPDAHVKRAAPRAPQRRGCREGFPYAANDLREKRYSGVTETLNFLLTNRIPRYALTRLMGWFSRIEQPWVRDLSLAAWQSFADLGLDEAKKTHF